MLGAVAAMITAATTGHASWVDVGTFAVSAAIVLAGAIGVVVARNPVHAALMLVMTLFGIAVLFVLQQASFLAAVQVIVYAGAIVVLFLFVIMFLGVDRTEDIAAEPLRGQRPLAIGLIALGTTGLLLLGQVSHWTTGAPHVAGPNTGAPNVNLLGRSVYTTYLFPFEATAALLIIAVVGAVVLARRPPATINPIDEESDPQARIGGPDATGDLVAGPGSTTVAPTSPAATPSTEPEPATAEAVTEPVTAEAVAPEAVTADAEGATTSSPATGNGAESVTVPGSHHEDLP
jgi:NADH-quinone oxidoreductase subunit J